MATLIFRSKQEFLAFTEKESKPKEPQQAPAAVPALTSEQVSKNTNAFIAGYLAQQRKQILTARKASPQKAKPQHTGGVRCTDCKHLFLETNFCNLIGKKQTNPQEARQCGYYNL